MVEIIDDFLDPQYHQNILEGLKTIAYHRELNNIWYHPFYNSLLNREWRIISRYWDAVREEFVKGRMDLCDPSNLYYMTAERALPTLIPTFKHTSYALKVNGIGALYYVTTNNTAPTIFKTWNKKRKLVFPKANRMVFFPNQLNYGTYFPLKEDRMLIQFNFKKHPLKLERGDG
tara:strand:- start:333 stop:854 length:522 start_codon:yes stop_codon:yes gene_type:complete